MYITSSSIYTSFTLDRLNDEDQGVHFTSVSMYCVRTDLQCVGDGDSDSSMIFVAQPSTANYMLQRLRFECTKPNIEDTVTITVYDDANGDTSTVDASKG